MRPLPRRSLLAAAALLCAGVVLRPAPAQDRPAQERPLPQTPVRAVWVTRWDWKTEAELRAVIERCAALGANRVLLQVRGHAAAYWPSQVEPWDPWLGGGDPGWDPLAVALEAARAQGLELEAWINVMPLWRGVDPPSDPAHPYLRHPEWVVVGSDGQPQRRTTHYVCANPALPAVRAHVASIASELATRYALDGVHMDYVRYVTDEERVLDFSRDPESLRLFGGDPDADRAGWERFKAAQVTATVREVRAAVRAARPGCRLTAAVFPTRQSRVRVAQDVETWVREGLVDALYPMTYAAETPEFERRLEETLFLGAGKVPVYPGVGVFQHRDPARTLEQLRRAREAGADGVALFCYASFFASADPAELREEDAALRARRVEALRGAWGE